MKLALPFRQLVTTLEECANKKDEKVIKMLNEYIKYFADSGFC